MINYDEAEKIEKNLGDFESLIELAHDPALHPALQLEVIQAIYVLTGNLL